MSEKVSTKEKISGKDIKNLLKAAVISGLSLMPTETNSDTPDIRQHETVSAAESEPEAYSEWESVGEYSLGLLYARAYENGVQTRTEVIFADERTGLMIGEQPVALTNAAGYTPIEMTYAYEDGQAVGIPGMWLRDQRAELSETYGIPAEDIEARHIYLDLRDYEEANTRLDVVRENASAIVPNDPQERSYIQYIQEELVLNSRVPDSVARYLRAVFPGLIAEESRYNPAVTSPAGAVGVAQTMLDTVEMYEERNDTHVNPRDITQQLPVAALQLETAYFEFENEISAELTAIAYEYFDGDIEAMQQYFLGPLVINAYNAGQGTMTRVFNAFFDRYPNREAVEELAGRTLSGYDLFFTMARTSHAQELVGNYGPAASTYVEKVMGWDAALETFMADLYFYEVRQVATEAADNQSVAHQDQRG